MSAQLTVPAVSLGEAQAFLRIDNGEEEALLAGIIRTATALCEAFINQVLVARPFSEERAASGEWQRLTHTPVMTINAVEAIAADGTTSVLPAGSYTIDVDSSGDGWVKVSDAGGATRVRVSGTAGMAADPNGIPEPIRQGVLRLVAHLFAARDGDSGDPPAAVTALWRPYRRMRLS